MFFSQFTIACAYMRSSSTINIISIYLLFSKFIENISLFFFYMVRLNLICIIETANKILIFLIIFLKIKKIKGIA